MLTTRDKMSHLLERLASISKKIKCTTTCPTPHPAIARGRHVRFYEMFFFVFKTVSSVKNFPAPAAGRLLNTNRNSNKSKNSHHNKNSININKWFHRFVVRKMASSKSGHFHTCPAASSNTSERLSRSA